VVFWNLKLETYCHNAMDRRSFLKTGAAGTVLASTLLESAAADHSQSATTRVIVVGGGIGGLTTGYELMKRGHEVVVMEAKGEPGGHVLTMEDGLADGLYADAGAEHFTEPGYDIYHELVEELGLTKLEYPRRKNRLYLGDDGEFRPADESPPGRYSLKDEGLNKQERQILLQHPNQGLRDLYFKPYIEAFEDEYQPLGIGFDHLDTMTVTELLERDGASDAAVRRAGGSSSALQSIWSDAILHLRDVPQAPTNLWRLKGGNQMLPLAMADQLGRSVRLGCEVTGIERGDTGVTVSFKEFGETKTMDAGYAVLSMPLPMVSRIDARPDWSPGKQYVIQNTTYYTATVFAMQSRTKFWEKDGLSPNLVFGRSSLQGVRQMAEEVDTPRGMLVGDADGQVDPQDALATFREHYPGNYDDIEHIQAKVWATDPWAPLCERLSFGLGELENFWPELMQPEGRVHFASSSTDNLSWGMEAATRSARRVANIITEEASG
jgi:monoamine oxidase